MAGICVLVGLGILLVCSVCNGQESAKQNKGQPPGKTEATWKFWESFSKAATSGAGIEALNTRAWKGKVDTAGTCAVLEDIIAGERERSRAITSLPVLHVDPDLARYAANFAASRTDLANALQDYVALAKKQEAMTSMPVLGVGLLLNLLNHTDDKEDGILWRALLDEGRQTDQNLQTLREPANAAEAKTVSVRSAMGRLNAEEMRVRINLAQRFDREFPPHDTYADVAAFDKLKDRHLSKKQIIQSLIGRHVGPVLDLWTFDSPKEFVTFKILSFTKLGDLRTDYEVQTRVKGIPSGEERNLKLHLTYGWVYTRWILVEVRQFE